MYPKDLLKTLSPIQAILTNAELFSYLSMARWWGGGGGGGGGFHYQLYVWGYRVDSHGM